MSLALDTPIAELNRVGRVAAKRLQHLRVETARDLLFYFPFRYEDFSRVVCVKDVRDHEAVTVKGKIELIANKRSSRQRTILTEALVADDTGRLRVVWFGQPFIAKNLRVGDMVYLSGSVSSDMFGRQMISPAYEREIRNSKFEIRNSTTHTARIVPIYSITAGLTQKQMRFLLKQVIDLAKEIEEWLPEEILDRADLILLPPALRAIHFPADADELKQAERRLKFDELFILQLRAEMIRQSLKQVKAPALHFKEQETRAFVASLPFILTKDQKIAAWEILRDLEKAEPMNRMLEGDVGSGKTVVAAMALYNCVLNGYQGVMLAPTEILAKQHFGSLEQLLPEWKLALLTAEELSAIGYRLSPPTRIAIIGEPNVGKSSLLNAILGREEVIVLPEPFTTRDVHDVDIEVDGRMVVLLDTAGIRRLAYRATRSSHTKLESIERIAVQRSIGAIRHADVVVFVLDGTAPASKHTKQLADAVLDEGKACIIVVNKMDLLPPPSRSVGGNKRVTRKSVSAIVTTAAEDRDIAMADHIHHLFPHLAWAPVLATSAERGTNVARIVPSALRAADAWRKTLVADELAAVHAAVKRKLPTPRTPLGKKKSAILEIQQSGAAPPTFILRSRKRIKLTRAIPSIVERVFRDTMDFEGTPIRIVVKSVKG